MKTCFLRLNVFPKFPARAEAVAKMHATNKSSRRSAFLLHEALSVSFTFPKSTVQDYVYSDNIRPQMREKNMTGHTTASPSKSAPGLATPYEFSSFR